MIYHYKTVAAMKSIRYVIHPSELLIHWQGHRARTRRVIEAFPQEALYNHCIGSLRPFSEMVQDLVTISTLAVHTIVPATRTNRPHMIALNHTKARLLSLWDETTLLINENWDELSLERFHETIPFWSLNECKVYEAIFYLIDTEVHHRGQAFVYLESLGITAPDF